MRKLILAVLVGIMTISLFACKDKVEKIEYNKEEGVAAGTVELTGKDPKISISNIKAKKGTDIDYLTGVVIEDEDQFDDLRVWVDASGVDIYEPGNYKAKYTFEYDGKSIKHEIIVTIIDEEAEESAGEISSTEQIVASGDGNNVGENQTTTRQDTVGNEPESTTKDNVVEKPTQTTLKDNVVDKPTQTTSKDNVVDKPTQTTSKDNVVDKPTQTTTKEQETTTKDSTTTTTKKELITTTGNETTKVQNIGYAYIELLSGSTVSIKTTTAKYIVSTRTDISYKTKNGAEYKVSKLIITYNTGEERTLETVEEKCN